MLTLFSIPKPFVGHIGVIQRNALSSWVRLCPGVQVVLLGNEEGIAAAAREAGAEHIPEVDRTEYGTPVVSSAFAKAAVVARNGLLCYVNGDIMLTDELTRAAASVSKRNFLMVGRRWNVEITEPWDFSNPEWREKLLTYAHQRGTLYRKDAIDYFVFPRDSRLTDLPPFAIGRPRWDNYFLFRCRQLGYTLIDATCVVTAVHQNHDYAHIPEGHWTYSPEAEANIKLLGDEARRFDMVDATHKLTRAGLRRTVGPEYSRRRRSTYVVLHPRQKLLVKAVVSLKAGLRRIGVLSPAEDL
jgi:hypothetical protein